MTQLNRNAENDDALVRGCTKLGVKPSARKSFSIDSLKTTLLDAIVFPAALYFVKAYRLLGATLRHHCETVHVFQQSPATRQHHSRVLSPSASPAPIAHGHLDARQLRASRGMPISHLEGSRRF
jgi:hypothetical protein